MKQVSPLQQRIDRAYLGLSRAFNRSAQGRYVKTHDSGHRLLVETDFRKDRLDFCFVVNCGAIHAPADKIEMAHFAEHQVLNRPGTGNMKLIEQFEDMGGILRAQTAFDRTMFYGSVPWTLGREKEIAALFGELLAAPKVDRESFYAERDIVETELLDQTGSWHADFNRASYLAAGTFPIEHSIDERIEGLKRIEPEDMQVFLDRYYRGSNIVAAFAGPVRLGMIDRLMQQHLGTVADADAQAQAGKAALRTYQGGARLIEQPGSKKTALGLGFGGARYEDPRLQAACLVLAEYLGIKGLKVLRGEQKLVYRAHASSYTTLAYQGVSLQTVCKPENAGKVVQGMTALIRDAAESIDEKALRRAIIKAQNSYNYSEQLDIPAGPFNAAFATYRIWEAADMHAPPLVDHRRYIPQVTAADLKQVVREKFLGGPIHYAATGDVSAVPPFEKLRQMLGKEPVKAGEPFVPPSV